MLVCRGFWCRAGLSTAPCLGLSPVKTILEDKLLGLRVLFSRVLKKIPRKGEAEIEITS